MPIIGRARYFRRPFRTNEINLLQNCLRIVAACRQTAAIFCKTKECGSLPRSRYAVLSRVEHLRDEIRLAVYGRLTRPREFLFLQHQGRSGPVCGSGEGDSEKFRSMICGRCVEAVKIEMRNFTQENFHTKARKDCSMLAAATLCHGSVLADLIGNAFQSFYN